MDARLTITLDKDEHVVAVQKGGGSGYFTVEEIVDATKTALEKTTELRKLVVKS